MSIIVHPLRCLVIQLPSKFTQNIEKESFEYEGEKLNITITIGVAEYTKDISLEQWVELADEKMYSGKNTGKNKVVA